MLRLKELQMEIESVLDRLEEYNYRIGDPLVGPDGYPRDDINIYEIKREIRKYKEKLEEYKELRKIVEEEVFSMLSKEE